MDKNRVHVTDVSRSEFCETGYKITELLLEYKAKLTEITLKHCAPSEKNF